MEIDIRKSTEIVTEIMWRDNTKWNIVRHYGCGGIRFKDFSIKSSIGAILPIVSKKETALNLIKAIEKAIELGWIK